MPLTDHQVEIKTAMLDAIRSGQKRVILEGAAGTGKTFLASEIVKELSRDYTINPLYNNGAVYVTAPTNKALSVLQSKIEGNRATEFKTIHSALRLRMWTNDKTGYRKFVKQNYVKDDGSKDFKSCRICMVDEASMVNSEILTFLQDYKFPIIFIGDRFQINPVGEPNTPVFEKSYPIFRLTEIVRQGKGNPIIDLSRDLDMIYFKEPHLVDGKGYVYDNNMEILIEQLAEVNGTDELKYLAFTNDKGAGNIDSINTMVRERIYGKPKRVEPNEVLVFNAPLGEHFTNKEVKVEKLEIITDNIPVPRASTKFDSAGVPMNGVDFVKMRTYKVNESFRIIHEDSDKMFQAISSTIRENCDRYNWTWKGKYFFDEQFANITYNHAITVHKSQGSTYKQAIINVANINFNRNAEEKQRLLYTAVTRASDLVILNSVK
jgi:exodeoxyribonuclease-5